MSLDYQDTSDREQDGKQKKKQRQGSSNDLPGEDYQRRDAAGFSLRLPLTRFRTCEGLKELVNRDCCDVDYQKFLKESRQSDYFKKPKSRSKMIKTNIFHELVVASRDWEQADIGKVLARLLRKPEVDKIHSNTDKKESSFDNFGYEELLEEEFDNGTPILTALTPGYARNLAFVEEILRLSPPPSNLGKIFWISSKNNIWAYCLHAGISAARHDDFDFHHIHQIIMQIQKYKPSSRKGATGRSKKPISPFEACNKASGDTPLHLAIKGAPINSGILENPKEAASTTAGANADRVEKYKKLIRTLIKACPRALGVKNQAEDSSGSRERTPYQERIYRLAQEFHKCKSSQAKGVLANSQQDDSADHKKLDGQGVGRRSTESIVSIGRRNSKMTNDQDSDERFLVRKYFWDDEFRKFVIIDPIASYISCHCITTLDRDMAMSYLYRRGEELSTEFDLLGFPRQTITKDFLESLETHVKFERTLKYVALPRLTVEAQINSALSSQSQPSQSREGNADMTALFQWLRDRHVRKIQKITVVDNEPPSHQDSKIVECLQKFDVELWEWEKMDLSSEVIWKSSKYVQKIWLHSSGNEAVLQGWSARGGFGDREKFPELTSIYIYFHEGQEDKATLEDRGQVIKSSLEAREAEILVEQASQSKLAHGFAEEVTELIKKIIQPTNIPNTFEDLRARAERFKTQVNSWSSLPKKELKVAFSTVPRGTRGGSSMIDRQLADPSQNERISRVKELTSFLRNATDSEKSAYEIPHRVKIAIIDDGLDSSLHIIDRKHSRVIAGQSFCNSSSEYTGSYYVPSGNHGTQVASLISQICPEVDLCIARLDEQYTRNAKRVIKPLSAQRAIEWATECGVDIICMSWTIETLDGPSSLEGLKAAIDQAADNNIIMFCSASDQGGSSKVYCYPGGFDDNKCIRIGSCSSSDLSSVWVNSNQVDFLLPGENIVVRNGDGTSESQTGSSFATAVAAGLGGLLIYCTLQLGIGTAPSARNPKDDEADNKEKDNISEFESESEGKTDDSSDGESTAKGKQKDHPSFPWDRDLMRNVFHSMSIYPHGQNGMGLVKPEESLNDKLVEELRKRFDKLKWDQTFKNALKKIIEGLGTLPRNAAYHKRSNK